MIRVLIVVVALASAQVASAQVADPATTLRDANAAATAGDWPRVNALVLPLFLLHLDPPDLAEAHRLAGLGAYFASQRADAEEHFLAYLRFDLEGHLDPALYPPDVVNFFNDVRARHAAELRARSRKSKRYIVLNLVPPLGQFQNGERTKGWILGGMLATFAITNVTSYLVLRSWCTRVSDTGGSSVTCDDKANHVHSATTLRSINLAAGLGLIATYVYGLYDGVTTYRRRDRVQPFAPYATPANDGVVVGITANF